MVLSAASFLGQNTTPTRDEIREAISGNLCRCTGYTKIVDAIEEAARELELAAERGE
jgi:carbon-monoxide dehydrogenase small subunit